MLPFNEWYHQYLAKHLYALSRCEGEAVAELAVIVLVMLVMLFMLVRSTDSPFDSGSLSGLIMFYCFTFFC